MFRSHTEIPCRSKAGGSEEEGGQETLKTVWIQNTVRTVQRIVFSCCVVGAVAPVFMMLLTVADVIGRSFFSRPITGTYELSRSFPVVIVLFGIAYAYQTWQHIAVNEAIEGYGLMDESMNIVREETQKRNVFFPY